METTDTSLDGKKIMWIEDDTFLNDIISRKLSSTKCVFFHSSSGEEALQIISEKMPDVILLDILLPGMDGFDILKKIKENPKIKDIPVIILSNLGQEGDIKRGKELGAALFLVKATTSLDEILEHTKQVINNNPK